MPRIAQSLRIVWAVSLMAGMLAGTFPGVAIAVNAGQTRAGSSRAKDDSVTNHDDQIPESTPAPVALSSGVPVTASLPAAAANSCAPGAVQYTIDVPTGATDLGISLTGNQTDNLLVSFGQPVSVVAGQAVADFIANTPGVNQSLSIGLSSTPPLQAGVYYIAVSNCSTAAFDFTITADVIGVPVTATPSIVGLSANLTGDLLTLTGTAQDAGGDMTEANVVFLDGAGNPLGTTTPFQYAFGSATSVAFTINVQGLERYLQALQVSMTVIDSRGNTSPPITASFANGDPGGPHLNVILFDGLTEMLTIKGFGFKAPVQLEVNGVIVAPPIKIKVKGGTKKMGGIKLVVHATGPNLNLENGFNRIRVICNGLRSPLVVVTI